jgi:hypothetical protein
MKCPSFERLIDYLDSRLPEADAEGVAAHLAGNCTACVESRDWYQQVRIVARTDDSVEPPAWMLKRALRIFEAPGHKPKLAVRLGQAIASLVFDSFTLPALAGVRSTETPNRQLLYRAGDYSIDLQIAPTEHTHAVLIGQLLRENEATFDSVSGLKLDITRDGKVLFSAVTDEMGEFQVSGIEQGKYDLRVELPKGSITVPDLPVTGS